MVEAMSFAPTAPSAAKQPMLTVPHATGNVSLSTTGFSANGLSTTGFRTNGVSAPAQPADAAPWQQAGAAPTPAALSGTAAGLFTCQPTTGNAQQLPHCSRSLSSDVVPSLDTTTSASQHDGPGSQHERTGHHLAMLLDTLAARVGAEEALTVASFALTGERVAPAVVAARVLSVAQATRQPLHHHLRRGSNSLLGAETVPQHSGEGAPSPHGGSFLAASRSFSRMMANNKIAPEEKQEDLGFGARATRGLSFADLVHALSARGIPQGSGVAAGAGRPMRARSMSAAQVAGSLRPRTLDTAAVSASAAASGMGIIAPGSDSDSGMRAVASAASSRRRWHSETNVPQAPAVAAPGGLPLTGSDGPVVHTEPAGAAAAALGSTPGTDRSYAGISSVSGGAAAVSLPGMADRGAPGARADAAGRLHARLQELLDTSSATTAAAQHHSDAADAAMQPVPLLEGASSGAGADAAAEPSKNSLAAAWAQIAHSRTAKGSARMGSRATMASAWRQGSGAMLMDVDAQESSMLPVLQSLSPDTSLLRALRPSTASLMMMARAPRALSASSGASGTRPTTADGFSRGTCGTSSTRPATVSGMSRQAAAGSRGAGTLHAGAYQRGPFASMPTLMEEPARAAMLQGLAGAGGRAESAGGSQELGAVTHIRTAAAHAGAHAAEARADTFSPRAAAGLPLTADVSGLQTRRSFEGGLGQVVGPAQDAADIAQSSTSVPQPEAEAGAASAQSCATAGPVAEGTEAVSVQRRLASSTDVPNHPLPASHGDLASVHLQGAGPAVWRPAVLRAVLSMVRVLEAMVAQVADAAAELASMQCLVFAAVDPAKGLQPSSQTGPDTLRRAVLDGGASMQALQALAAVDIHAALRALAARAMYHVPSGAQHATTSMRHGASMRQPQADAAQAQLVSMLRGVATLTAR